jgi:hypothetical protein
LPKAINYPLSDFTKILPKSEQQLLDEKNEKIASEKALEYMNDK